MTWTLNNCTIKSPNDYCRLHFFQSLIALSEFWHKLTAINIIVKLPFINCVLPFITIIAIIYDYKNKTKS